MSAVCLRTCGPEEISEYGIVRRQPACARSSDGDRGPLVPSGVPGEAGVADDGGGEGGGAVHSPDRRLAAVVLECDRGAVGLPGQASPARSLPIRGRTGTHSAPAATMATASPTAGRSAFREAAVRTQVSKPLVPSLTKRYSTSNLGARNHRKLCEHWLKVHLNINLC